MRNTEKQTQKCREMIRIHFSQIFYRNFFSSPPTSAIHFLIYSYLYFEARLIIAIPIYRMCLVPSMKTVLLHRYLCPIRLRAATSPTEKKVLRFSILEHCSSEAPYTHF